VTTVNDQAPIDLIDETAAAEMLQRPVGTLRWWRCHGRGPRFYRIGRNVRYRPADLAAFVERCAIDPARAA
jgi:hypothetical protein